MGIILGIWGYGKEHGGGEEVGADGDYDVQAGRYWGVFERGRTIWMFSRGQY